MTVEEFEELCEFSPEFRHHMRVAFYVMETNKDALAALADGAVPTEEGKAKAAAFRNALEKKYENKS